MKISVNIKAPVLARDQIVIQASLSTVWDVITSINHWPKWQKDVTEVRLDGEIEEGKTFVWKAGGLKFTSKIHTISRHHLFGWTGKTLGVKAIHNWNFQKENASTMVEVEESLEGTLPTLFKKYFQRKLEEGMRKNLIELKTASELQVDTQ